MSLQLIKHTDKRRYANGTTILHVSELFSETIQGEGIYTGVPAIFLRFSHCTLNCVWCDSRNVWKKFNEYSVEELLGVFEKNGLVDQLQNGVHLVLTGGSPLLQQRRIIVFLEKFEVKYKFIPFIEIENECRIKPDERLEYYISCWNNSPKLHNSGLKENGQFYRQLLIYMNSLENSWFKFVVKNEEDWKEIENKYFQLIDRNKVLLMPEGDTRRKLSNSAPIVCDIAVKNNVRFCNREHIILWNKKTGV